MRYHNNPLKLKNIPPQIHEEFLKICFFPKRTTNSFSRLPVDLTLEQAINTDALCQRKGILTFTSSIDPRQRWAHSDFIRTSIISLEDLNLSVKGDVSQDLKRSQISQNSTHLAKFIKIIKLTMNSFSFNVEENCLFNVAYLIKVQMMK